ncbi:hypothetical protein VTN77DRAFT_2104 [Rasamsonia byssochlamydoides]|uniref:uncharacterized protein n=1 Tax=Rasamsonia byssochlamydoides TaxID=89139 RepID=UPI0037440C58
MSSASTFSISNSSPSASAYMVPSTSNSYPLDSDDEIASLPSEPTAESDLEDDMSLSGYSDAEEQWRESIQQLELLLTMVIVPFIGKYFGRKCAYWGWTKFMEWKYPIEVVMSDRAEFRTTGVVGAASL